MGDARRGDDDIAFYSATLGRTTMIPVTDAAAQLPDTDPLGPGRYLLHLGGLSAGAVIWVATAPFVKGGGLIPVAAAVPYFPMQTTGILGFELNVRKGDNDRIAAVANGGASGTLFITLISRGA